MNVVAFPIVGPLAIAILAGLLMLVAYALSRYNASGHKRSQGVTVAAIVLGVVVLGVGLFTVRTVREDVAREQVHENLTQIHSAWAAAHNVPDSEHGRSVESYIVDLSAPPAVPPGVTVHGNGGALRIESGAVQHVQLHRGEAKLAWGPIAIITLVVGGVVLVAASRRGTRAILAGLGIVMGLLLLYALSFRSEVVRTARAPTMMPPAAAAHATPAAVSHAKEAATAAGTTQISETDATTAASAEKDKSSADGKADAGMTKAEKAEADKSKAKAGPDAERSSADSKTAEKEPKPATPPPAWVGSQPRIENGVYYASVVSGPYSTEWECEWQLRGPLQEAVRRYAERYLRPGARSSAWSSFDWNNANVLREQIIEDEYLESVQASFGPMLKLHALVKIDQNDVARFEQIAREWEVNEAVKVASASAACLLGALVVVYGGLRYVGRKKPGAPEPAATEALA